MKPRIRARAAVVAIVIALASVAGATNANAVEPSQVESIGYGIRPTALDGVCGSLLTAGTSLGSLGRTVAARGAGWVGAIVSARCLLADVNEYSKQFHATPEGIAFVRELKNRYGAYTFEDFMAEFDCTFVESGRGPADSVDSARRRGYWNCDNGRD
ncbi:hypothetical protein ACQEVB_17410 [Pseudonocardia sp. CA-107938]|uniref:hypothetical protein n=1 Tax=Pseudonocardia sp. CA-107938 TaxID=3240021 RepID=UPI003D92F16D